MHEVLITTGVVVFFAVGAAYLVATARILGRTGDIDEPPDDADAEADDEQVPSWLLDGDPTGSDPPETSNDEAGGTPAIARLVPPR